MFSLRFLLFPTLIFSLLSCGPFSDDKIQSLLQNNKSAFEQLIEISKDCINDKVIILYAKRTDHKGCANLMKDLSVEGMSKYKNGRIYFYLNDFNYSGEQKGLVYSEETLTPLYKSLNSKPKRLRPYQEGYKFIDKNWYIYYSYDA